MRIDLCKSCGEPYDTDEINDGYCLLCQPGAAMVLSMIVDLDLTEPEETCS